MLSDADSGIEASSMPESRESSPNSNEVKLQSMIELPPPKDLPTNDDDDDDDDDDEPDETMAERLVGLTEMFPETLRNGLCTLVSSSKHGVCSLYGYSRAALWIFFSSSAILVAPIIFEMERIQMDEMQKQQQRQILLGPSAAVSGGIGAPPMAFGVPQPART